MKITNWINIHKKDILAIAALIILGIPSSINLFHKGYFSMHDDMQVIRLYEMEQCLLDGQIPCRWAPDMTVGYGQPLYNFYSVFPYYTGMLIRAFGFQFIDVVKILFALTLIPSAIFMYFLVREFFGKLAGLVGALFFLYAPYHAVDVYVRGALAEASAITFLPLIFLSIYKFIKEERISWMILFIFSLSAVFLSHNIMSMISFPFLILWSVFWLITLKKIKIFPKVILVFVWTLGLSAFFLIPAFLEKNYVLIESLRSDYYSYILHFVTKSQLLFLRYWDYGPSLGVNSRMSFQIGWPHWWMVILVLPFLAWVYWKKQERTKIMTIGFFIFMFMVTSFMTHNKSLFLWQNIPMLPFVQFPWRFLGIIIFSVSFTAGSFIFLLRLIRIPEKLIIFIGIVLIAAVIGLNYSYFHPQYIFGFVTDKYKLSGKEMEGQMKSALLDYLPKTVKKIPEEIAPANPWVIEGVARISEFDKRSDFWRFTIEVNGDKTARVKVPVLDFPKWEVLIDQKLTSFSNNNPEGVIEFDVPPGNHTVVGWFKNTFLRKISNGISVLSFAGLILLVVVKDRKNEETV